MDTTAVEAGAQAPDVKVRSAGDADVMLSDLWSKQKTVLVFLRHFG